MSAMYVTTSLLVSNWPELSESKVVLDSRQAGLAGRLVGGCGLARLVLALSVLTVVGLGRADLSSWLVGVGGRSGFFCGSHRAPSSWAGLGWLLGKLVSLRKALTRGPTKTLSNAKIIFVINLSVMHSLIFQK